MFLCIPGSSQCVPGRWNVLGDPCTDCSQAEAELEVTRTTQKTPSSTVQPEEHSHMPRTPGTSGVCDRTPSSYMQPPCPLTLSHQDSQFCPSQWCQKMKQEWGISPARHSDVLTLSVSAEVRTTQRIQNPAQAKHQKLCRPARTASAFRENKG